MKNPYAAFWQAHAAGKIRDIKLGTDMDPAARFNYGHRAHHGQVMAKNYKEKAVIKLTDPLPMEPASVETLP